MSVSSKFTNESYSVFRIMEFLGDNQLAVQLSTRFLSHFCSAKSIAFVCPSGTYGLILPRCVKPNPVKWARVVYVYL